MKPTDLRGILQYIPRFRDRIFVLSVDGAIVTDENFSNILLDIAVLRSLNIRVVLVHGAMAQIQSLAATNHQTPSDLEGSGVTDFETFDLALTASSRVTHEILKGLATTDIRAAHTNAVIAHPLGIIKGVDHRFTGKVERVDTELLRNLLNHDVVPVVPPLGFDGDGRSYRVNSDAVAVAVASALDAVKLVFITPRDGLVHAGDLIRQIPLADLDRLLQSPSTFAPEFVSKAMHAARACHAGIARVHIINGRVEEGLLAEVFSNEGIGTLVYANEYQQIRPAMKKDVRSIYRLTRTSVVNQELVKRTQSTIEKRLEDYFIFEIDRNPVGCVALHVYPEDGKGELAYLCVSPSHENQGIGRKLVHFVETRARQLGLRELISLSTQAFNFFQSKAGFSEGGPDDLPAARKRQYEASGRKSRILRKRLG